MIPETGMIMVQRRKVSLCCSKDIQAVKSADKRYNLLEDSSRIHLRNL